MDNLKKTKRTTPKAMEGSKRKRKTTSANSERIVNSHCNVFVFVFLQQAETFVGRGRPICFNYKL